MASLILMFSLVMISIFNADISGPDIPESECYPSFGKLETPQPQMETNIPNPRGIRESTIESTSHGGSWLDSFDDDTGIDWAMSDNLLLYKSNVKIKKLILSKPFEKDFSTVGLWHFDEGSGITVYDETDNYNNGTLGGDGVGTDLPSWTTGKFDSALGFDGVDDYIAISDNSSLRLREAFTLHVWVKPISSTGGTWQTILEKGSDSYGMYFSNDLTFQVYNGGLNPVNIKTPPVTLGEWYHLVSTYDKFEGFRKLYLNGELVASSTHSSNISDSVGNPLGINRHPNNGDAFFNGIIDEVAICNRSLTAPEIYSLYGGDRYHITGNITSKIITLPANMHWDTIFINKTQPRNSYLNVTVLDASNDKLIPGALKYIDQGEFDISYIDPLKYPSIKLNATFEGNGSTTATLYSWGVSWLGDNCWKDSIFGGDKVDKEDKLTLDGNMIFSGSLYGIGTIDSNAAAIWHLDENTGTVVEDAYRNKDGNIQGGASWTSGKYGTSLSFDGVDDYVNAPSVFSGNGDITMSAWVKFDTISYSSYPRIIFIGKPMSNQAIQMFEMNGTGQLGVGRWNGPRAITTKYYNDGSWHQVVGRFYNRNTYDIFVDGEFEASNSGAYSIPSDGITMIGGRPYSEYWKGSIDEVIMYKRALTDLEIRNWYYSIKDIKSKSIDLPEGTHWDQLIINKTESPNGWLNITILDGNTNQPIEGYFNLKDTVIDISSIDPILHKSIKLNAQAGENSFGLVTLHDWSVNWTTNTPPKINGIIEVSNTVYRTNNTQIHINVSDSCDPPQRLTVDIGYKSPKDSTWKNEYLSNFHLENDTWVITFTPTKNADIGYYSFEVICKDSFESEVTKNFENIIEVLNNPPTKPNVTILPKTPNTNDDLRAYVTNSTDIEAEPITYYYEWYKNTELQPELTTELVPAIYTFKNESWKCIVTPNDGYDNGPGAEVEAFIRNLQPEILTIGNFSGEVGIPFELKLEASDDDNNISDLTWALNSIIDFLIIEPDTGILTGTPNLEGYFFINVSVRDSDGGVDWLQFRLNIIKVNRPPIITTIDIGSAKTGEFYYLDCNATDDFTSSELLKWGLNTNASWLKINITTGELSGTPSKTDAGWSWVNITLIDDEGGRTYRYFVLNISQSPNILPKLSSSKMMPREGDTNMEFKFSVHYSDDDSEPPTIIQVVIDEVRLDLELLPGETPYKGKYEIITKLPKGEHTFYFMASDGTDTITTEHFQTPYIKDARADEPTEINWTWINLIVIIVIIIIIILLVILLRKKKQRSKEEEILSKQPQLKKPIITPVLKSSQIPTPGTELRETSQISTSYEPQPLSPDSRKTPALPPVTEYTEQVTLIPDEGQEVPEIVEDSESTLEDHQDVVVDLPTDGLDAELKSERVVEEPESIFKGVELLPDDAEYLASESPELIEDTRPLTEPMPITPEPEIKDEFSEREVQGSVEKTMENIQPPTDTEQSLDQQPKPKTTQSQPLPEKDKESNN
ncbi:LamG-like jellyroll fold domain-containing protein [[Eubacterium] cellulosolvens]